MADLDLALAGQAPGRRPGLEPLALRYAAVRAQTQALAAPLSEADVQVQSMPDASPTKWHLAHVTWFFETFLLERFEPAFKPHQAAFRVLYNSYYQGVGDQHPRAQRGLVTRPTLAEVWAYRAGVDERVLRLLRTAPAADHAGIASILALGLQHEQQHQELLLTDVLHLFSCNPMDPAYRPAGSAVPGLSPVEPAEAPLQWIEQAGGLVEIGHDPQRDGSGFAFDNEGPRHRAYLNPYALAHRLTTHADWAAFIADGGYADARWWLAAGWDWASRQHIRAPLYWRRAPAADPAGDWQVFTLNGLQTPAGQTPVSHISLYEADAYARWYGARHGMPTRLPTEAEWEHAAAPLSGQGIAGGNFVESLALQPVAARQPSTGLQQLFGDVWEWTSSSYLPYPGFRAWEGAVGEYNGKFMVNQTVLRGGSCATPRDHIRSSYRNFFPAETRWQFSGLRLARDAG
jgi:ergothioneine biosynthesis protein EgtB